MKELRDTGTPELVKRRKVQPRRRAASGYDFDLYVVDGSGPDRMLLAGVININQHAALLSLTVMMHRAKMLGPKPPSFERVSNSDHVAVTQKQADALRKVGGIISALDREVGRVGREQVIDLCMMDRPPEDVPLLVKGAEALRIYIS